jgi:hypothetical protein
VKGRQNITSIACQFRVNTCACSLITYTAYYLTSTSLVLLLLQPCLDLLNPLPNLPPLLPLALRQPPLNRQSSALKRPVPRNPLHRLLDPDNPKLADKLLGRAHRVLQLLHLGQRLVVQRPRRRQLEQRADGAREDGSEPVDDACGIEDDNGTQLLAQSAVDFELRVVDFGVERDLVVVRDDSVRHLAADNAGVCGEGAVCRGRDRYAVGYAGVVVAAPLLSVASRKTPFISLSFPVLDQKPGKRKLTSK